MRLRRFSPLSSGFGLVYQALAAGGERGQAAITAWGLSQTEGSEEFAAACGDPDARPELAMAYFGFLDPIEAARRALADADPRDAVGVLDATHRLALVGGL